MIIIIISLILFYIANFIIQMLALAIGVMVYSQAKSSIMANFLMIILGLSIPYFMFKSFALLFDNFQEYRWFHFLCILFIVGGMNKGNEKNTNESSYTVSTTLFSASILMSILMFWLV